MTATFDESQVFDANLSIWHGATVNKDGTFSYEEEGFDPIPLDIYTAASLGEDDIVQDILDKKNIRINSKNSGGWSPLMYASYMGHRNTVQLLLENDADPNQKSPNGSSPLVLASLCGNESTMESLIQRGADVESRDNRGWTALFHATSSGHQQTTEFLLKIGANIETLEPSQGLTPLMEAAASGHEMIVQQLLQNGADPTRQDYQGEDAATLAKAYGHSKIVSLIDQYTRRRERSNYNHQRVKHHGNNRKNSSNSVPSIHAGPKAFAAMTGLGADGKPHPHSTVPVFLQDHPPHMSEAMTKPAKWEGPKDLESLLTDIGCSKYYPIFKEQDVDLQTFLTLSESDLKEIGIKLFGPRRKMESVINRLTSGIQTNLSNHPEAAYADGLNARVQVLQTKLKQFQETKETLESHLAQERELRRVTEGVLVSHEEVLTTLRRLSEKWTTTQVQLGQGLEQVRACLQDNEQITLVNRSSRRDKLDTLKLMKEIDNVFRNTRDYMLEMQAILQRAISSGSNTSDRVCSR